MSDIYNTMFGSHTSLRTIGQAILFGMDGGLFMSVSYNRDVLASRKKSIISLAYNTIIANKQASNMKTMAWTACGSDLYNLFEVIIPGGSLFLFLFLFHL